MSRFLCAFLALGALAGSAFGSTVRADGPIIVVNEVAVLRLMTHAGRMSPVARAQSFAARLETVDLIADLTTKPANNACRIVQGDRVLLTVSEPEAEAHGSTPEGLAQDWVAAIRQAWLLPAVRLNRDSATLPPNGQASVSLVGSEARNAPIAVQNPDIASASRTGATLLVTGKSVGETTVSIGLATFLVKVLPYAAEFPQRFAVSVTGIPTNENTVEAVVEATVKARFEAVQSAHITVRSIQTQSLAPGASRTVSVRVSAEAPDAFPTSGLVGVDVTNVAVPFSRDAALWYCNDPEDIHKPQALFRRRLQVDRPVRLLYHHINQTARPLFFRVLVLNESEEPGRFVISPGDAMPDQNPVLAGLEAGAAFFSDRQFRSGEVIELPPHRSIPISFHRVGPRDTVSGLCTLRLLANGPQELTVVAEAIPPYDLDPEWSRAMESLTPWRELREPSVLQPIFTTGDVGAVYPSPYLHDSFDYKVGGNFAYFRLGEQALKAAEGAKPLLGNFGVTYTIDAHAENPTNAPASLELVYQDGAGYSGGVFDVGGQFVKVQPMQPGTEVRLARFRLSPGETHTISVTTIPLSGSSYPSNFILRPVSNLPDIGH